jgi:hypothetical protein
MLNVEFLRFVHLRPARAERVFGKAASEPIQLAYWLSFWRSARFDGSFLNAASTPGSGQTGYWIKP